MAPLACQLQSQSSVTLLTVKAGECRIIALPANPVDESSFSSCQEKCSCLTALCGGYGLLQWSWWCGASLERLSSALSQHFRNIDFCRQKLCLDGIVWDNLCQLLSPLPLPVVLLTSADTAPAQKQPISLNAVNHTCVCLQGRFMHGCTCRSASVSITFSLTIKLE